MKCLQLPQTRRLTKQRQLILDILKKDYSHPTAEQVYNQVRKKLPRISLATIYRNLNFLVKLGLIKELNLNDQVSRFDGQATEHDHFICYACHNVYDIPKYSFHKKHLSAKKYTIGTFRLDYFGICDKCQDKKPCLNYFNFKTNN